jgi:hypothetical protein
MLLIFRYCDLIEYFGSMDNMFQFTTIDQILTGDEHIFESIEYLLCFEGDLLVVKFEAGLREDGRTED